jgi:hypothetical protein
MKFALLPLIALLALMVACSDDSNTPAAAPTSPEDAVQIDPSQLSAVVLQPSDLPPGYSSVGSFNPGGQVATSYLSKFTRPGDTVASTVAQYPSVGARNDGVPHLRDGFSHLLGAESDYDLPGSDAAFSYIGSTPPSQGVLVLRGRYLVNIVLQTSDDSEPGRLATRAALDRYTSIVFDRLLKLLADPTSVTPIAGAPTFDPNRPGVPGRTAGPQPPTAP